MVSIDEAQVILDEIAQGLPAAFFGRLNGGISLLPEAKLNPLGRANELYILGEYHAGGAMGRYISIYYGSLARVYGGADQNIWREKLEEVLLHEFTHHLESLAGERGLEIKDRQQMERYLGRQ